MARAPSYTEQEERWVEAWNALDEVLGRGGGGCLLPDGTLVSVEDGRGFLQSSAYEGYALQVEPGWALGRRVAVLTRSR